MKEKILKEWNKPDWSQVDSEYLSKLEENNDNYKIAIEQIIDLINCEENSDQKILDINDAINQLQEQIYYI